MPLTPIIFRSVSYRLSRAYSGGVELQSYHKVILYTENYRNGSAYFVEGFNAFEFTAEGHRSIWSFRKQTLTPQMIFNFDRFRVIGSEIWPPTLRSRLSTTTAPWALKVNEEHNVFSANLRDTDASWGQKIEAFNCTSLGTNTNIQFYDRDVRSVGKQRNILTARARLQPTPPPEAVSDPLLETV